MKSVTEKVGFHPTFFRQGNVKTSFHCSSGLTKTLAHPNAIQIICLVNLFTNTSSIPRFIILNRGITVIYFTD
jgi:hypothetical protein